MLSLKDCLPNLALLTLLSSQPKHRNNHPNHALSPVVFRQVQFWGPSCSSSKYTILHSAHSSKHPQLNVIYTLMTPIHLFLSKQHPRLPISSPPGILDSFIHSFIHTEHLYSASSRELLRGAPDSSTAKKSSMTWMWMTSNLLCLNFSKTEFILNDRQA